MPTYTPRPTQYFVEVLSYSSSVELGPGAKESCGVKEHVEEIELQGVDLILITVSSAREVNIYIHSQDKRGQDPKKLRGDKGYAQRIRVTNLEVWPYSVPYSDTYLLRIESDWSRGDGSCNEALSSVDFGYRVLRLKN
jgi:hypothetical protein